MAVKVLIFLSFIAFALADDFIIQESTQKVVDECLDENNLSEETVHEFAQQENTMTASDEIKDFFFCVTKKLDTFDGNEWNMEKVRSLVSDPDKVKDVEECLLKDDKTSEPRDRNFAVISCCIQKEAFL